MRDRSSLLLIRFGGQLLLESCEARPEEVAVRIEPRIGLYERRGFEPARPPLRRPALDDEPGPLEHLQVPRHGRQAHRMWRRELVHRGFAFREPRQDRPARRVGEGGKGYAWRIRFHLTLMLIS